MQHADALVRLRYAVDSMKGLAVVVGGVGPEKQHLQGEYLTNSMKINTKPLCSLCSIQLLPLTGFEKIAIQLGVENVAEDKLIYWGNYIKTDTYK
jgi:hypothetical protein